MNALRGLAEALRFHESTISMAQMAERMALGRPLSLRAMMKDEDADGLPDAFEQALAERFAPIVYHSSDESNFPTNVDWFLSKTELWFYDDACTPDLHMPIIKSPAQHQLLGQRYSGGCGATDTILSDATRSLSKQRTFYLKDVADEHRRGSYDSEDWTTYFHVYPNNRGGVTIQYWRFYAYNDAIFNHGGDWEGCHIVLDEHLHPAMIVLMGHTTIERCSPSELTWEGDHVRVYSEGGGHATCRSGREVNANGGQGYIDPAVQCTHVRHETWPGGIVWWFDGRVTCTGRLLNIGSKIAPMNGQVFIQYSGLWGSPGTIGASSGYWGPAYNETQMGDDGFITAWAEGMIGDPETLRAECYPASRSR